MDYTQKHILKINLVKNKYGIKLIMRFKTSSQYFNLNWLRIFSLILSIILLPFSLEAKVVKGIVVDNATEKPIANSIVMLLEKKTIYAIAVTDSTGIFIFENVSLDRFNLVARRIGYAEVTTGPLLMTNVDTLKLIVRLEVEGILMDEIVVQETKIDESLKRAGYYGRKESGLGKYLGFMDLKSKTFNKTSDVLKTIPNMIIHDDWGNITIYSTRYRIGTGLLRADNPKVTVYIDGMLIDNHDLVNTIGPKDIAAIEFYKSSSTAPMQYSGNSRPGGVLLIWTKRQ